MPTEELINRQLTSTQLTGQDSSELVPLPKSLSTREGLVAHPLAITALAKLQKAAAKANVPFEVLSSYRSFEQQKSIWNRKFCGEQTILDMNENSIDITCLTDLEKIHSIMRYSALPGASRHHWGTDFDIFPSAALKEGYKPQLLVSEFVNTADGKSTAVASELHQWLITNLHESDFFRPYKRFQNGIAAEPWHLSYQPIADSALMQLSLEMLKETIQQSADFSGYESVISHLPSLFEQYIQNICQKEN